MLTRSQDTHPEGSESGRRSDSRRGKASVENEAAGKGSDTGRRAARMKRQRESIPASVDEPKYEIEVLQTENNKDNVGQEVTGDFGVKENSSGNATGSKQTKGEGAERGILHDTNELDWEDGVISTTSEPEEDFSHHLGRAVTVEFTESPSAIQRKASRRATPREKEMAELVHKVHLLCLLSRGRLVDRACGEPLIQASLLSLVPPHLLKIPEVPNLTVATLGPLVTWNKFHIQSHNIDRESFKPNLAFAVQAYEGTAEEVAALSVALFRALNLTTRFVSLLDVVSLKPDMDVSGCSNYDAARLDTKILSSNTVRRTDQVLTLTPHHSSDNTYSNNMPHETSPSNKHQKKNGSPIHNINLPEGSALACRLDATNGAITGKQCSDNSESCPSICSEVPRRKGDIEFELQLEMALSATAARIGNSDLGSNVDELSSSSSFPTLASKRLRKSKLEQPVFVTHDSSSAVWSRKLGPPFYWAEVYCGGESQNGRWVHVDAANGIIDGEHNVEPAAAACKRPLKYVVVFAGGGAKDVTRRYCKHWYKIAPQRVNPQWWDTVLAPLKQLESGATGGTGSMVPLESSQPTASADLEEKPSEAALTNFLRTPFSHKCPSPVNVVSELAESSENKINNAIDVSATQNSWFDTRNSLEDMELETRALTEPLPTNQQAYKNHHLYALEKWLTKFQVLHPNGPVLGYCSGNPVYPRSCVQTVQTKQKWMREGLQVRANEIPAKVVKHSKKLVKVHPLESNTLEEDDLEGTVELFGRWQMEPLCLPSAVNGIVPKNERGRVDVWSEKCLPPGTVHLKLPRLAPVAKRLEIDFAHAMVGFEFRNGRSFPVFEGIVVCTEFKDAILVAYAEEEERREAEQKRRNESQALARWFQLLSSVVTRQRLKNIYADSSFQSPQKEKINLPVSQASGCETEMRQSETQEGLIQNASMVSSPAVHDHEHVFPAENGSFDEETLVWTKRCPCGFSVQVEEL